MCDHCVKRERAYVALGTDEQAAVDQFSAQAEPGLVMLKMGPDQETFETAYVEFGDTLDILLGIAATTSADIVPPEWL